MSKVDNAKSEWFTIPGVRHQTLAGPEHGTKEMELWQQYFAPNCESPWHRHPAEELIYILKGKGECEVVGEGMVSFEANQTLIIPADSVHIIRNVGAEELWLIAALSQSPLDARSADNVPITLPWQVVPVARGDDAGAGMELEKIMGKEA